MFAPHVTPFVYTCVVTHSSPHLAGTLRPPLPHVVSFLLEAYPSAASHIDPYTQTLPLHNILPRFRGSEPETLHHALDLYEDAVKCHLPGNLAADDGKPCLLRLILQVRNVKSEKRGF